MKTILALLLSLSVGLKADNQNIDNITGFAASNFYDKLTTAAMTLYGALTSTAAVNLAQIGGAAAVTWSVTTLAGKVPVVLSSGNNGAPFASSSNAVSSNLAAGLSSMSVASFGYASNGTSWTANASTLGSDGRPALNVYQTAPGVTWTAACNTAKLYQVHYVVTATTGSVTFVLASPTAAGKIIHVKAFHTYASNATVSGGGLVNLHARDSLTGVTVSVSSVYLPNVVASAAAQIEIDNDDNNMWGPCGWPMSAGALMQCNLTANITNGNWVIHAVWWEE